MVTSFVAALLIAPPVTIEPNTLMKHVKFLASRELAGRMTLRPAMDKVADYFAAEFRRYGLEGREGGEGYIHLYDLSANLRATKNNMLSFNLAGGKTISLEVDKDFAPLVGSQTRIVRGNVVWVGYGSEADYEGAEVAEKVVMMFRGAQDGSTRTNSMKARLAKEKGAAGVLFIGSNGEGRADLPTYSRQQGVAESTDIVAAALHQKWFTELTGLDYAAARANKEKQTKSLGAIVRMVTETEANTGKAKNVIGYLPGTDPVLRNEFIIIGGHFDHLGFGEIGSRSGMDMIHYGADDNGSGAAGVLAAAEWFAKHRVNRRTIIFQGYSAEELGLRGSRAWVDSNKDKLPQVAGMLNMDMIGSVRFNQTFVYGLTSSNDWLPLFSKVKVDGLKLLLCPNARGDSDQASFVAASVPALFFHTGLTDEYHTEKDTWDRVNYPGAADVVEAVIQTALQLDASPKKMAFNPNVERGNRPTDRRPPTGPMESPLKPPTN